MTQNDLRLLLRSVADGSLSVDEAVTRFRLAPYEDLGFAKPDTHRAIRSGTAEVIYGEGKTPSQITEIARTMLDGGQETVLITRLSSAAADEINLTLPLEYHEIGRIGIAGAIPKPSTSTSIAVVSAGTSDMPVAEEAALTAEALGSRVVRLYDVGVAGLHRLLSHADQIAKAKVIIAVAGMEGALASVVGGIADCPVIAVPTSVGYGASFGGMAALLAMLNSCSSNVSVVNIDNGFGAGYIANMINRI